MNREHELCLAGKIISIEKYEQLKEKCKPFPVNAVIGTIINDIISGDIKVTDPRMEGQYEISKA